MRCKLVVVPLPSDLYLPTPYFVPRYVSRPQPVKAGIMYGVRDGSPLRLFLFGEARIVDPFSFVRYFVFCTKYILRTAFPFSARILASHLMRGVLFHSLLHSPSAEPANLWENISDYHLTSFVHKRRCVVASDVLRSWIWTSSSTSLHIWGSLVLIPLHFQPWPPTL